MSNEFKMSFGTNNENGSIVTNLNNNNNKHNNNQIDFNNN